MRNTRPPNLQDSHFTIDSLVGVTVLPQNDERTYFMLFNHDAQEIEIHFGPGEFTPGTGILIPPGGHITLPDGVLGPIQLIEGGGGSASVTVLSPLEEDALATRISPP